MIRLKILKLIPWKLVFLTCLIFTLAFEYKPLEYSFAPIIDLYLPGSSNQKIYFFLSDVFAISLLLFYIKKRRKQELSVAQKTLSALAGGFVLSLGISIIFSPFSFFGWQFFRFMNFMVLIALGTALSLDREVFPRKLLIRTAFLALAIFASYQAFLALMQYIYQEPVGVIAEVNFLDPSIAETSLKIGKNKSWIFDSLNLIHLKEKYLHRAYGSMLHPNILGAVLFLGSLATTYFLLTTEKRWKKILLYIVCATQVLGLFVSYSRAASIAWMGAMVFCLAWYFYLNPKSRGFGKKVAIAMHFAMLIGVCSVLFYQQNLMRERADTSKLGNSVNERIHRVYDLDNRLHNQELALQLIENNPIVGVGLENYMPAAFQELEKKGYLSEKDIFPVHNIYLLMCVEAGLLGGIFFMAYLGFTLLQLIFSKITTPEQIILSAMFLGILFLGFCDFYLVVFQVGRVFLFLVPALLWRSLQSESISYQTIDLRK